MFLASLALPFHTWFDFVGAISALLLTTVVVATVHSQSTQHRTAQSTQSSHSPPPPSPITWHPLHVQYLVSPRFRDPHPHIPHASIPAQPASSAHHPTCRAWVGVASEPLSLVICFLNSAVPVVPRKELERRTPTPLGDGPERRAARQQSTRSVPASSPLQPWRHGVAWHVKLRYLRRSTSYGGGMHVR